MSKNEVFLDKQIGHSITIERYKSGTVGKMIALLNRAEKDLIGQISSRLSAIEERGFDLGKDTTKRLDALLGEITAKRKELYAGFESGLSQELIEYSGEEIAFQKKLAEITISQSLIKPTNAKIKAIVTSQPFRGRILKDWAAGLEANDVRRIHDAIKIGMIEGQTTDQIVRRVRGSRANQYKDGVLEISRREAQTVVRTSVAHVANRSREQLWSDNADIIEGVQWVSTLDSRTSSICRERDNKVYPVDKGPRPPAHFNCRSVMVAAFSEDGTRASDIGPVPQSMSYGDWLKKQSKAVQEDVLGVKKAKLYRDGGLSIDRFQDKAGNAYTLDQLRKKNESVWNKVFE